VAVKSRHSGLQAEIHDRGIGVRRSLVTMAAFQKALARKKFVSKAVRCSMSIPWVWSVQRWDRRLLVDGQLLPWILSGIEMMGDGCSPVTRTVMLRIASDNSHPLASEKRLWPWDFAKILLETMLTALDNQRVAGPLWEDTVLIQVSGIHTLQLGLSRSDKARLFQCGYDQVRKYFHKHSSNVLPGTA